MNQFFYYSSLAQNIINEATELTMRSRKSMVETLLKATYMSLIGKINDLLKEGSEEGGNGGRGGSSGIRFIGNNSSGEVTMACQAFSNILGASIQLDKNGRVSCLIPGIISNVSEKNLEGLQIFSEILSGAVSENLTIDVGFFDNSEMDGDGALTYPPGGVSENWTVALNRDIFINGNDPENVTCLFGNHNILGWDTGLADLEDIPFTIERDIAHEFFGHIFSALCDPDFYNNYQEYKNDNYDPLEIPAIQTENTLMGPPYRVTHGNMIEWQYWIFGPDRNLYLPRNKQLKGK